MKISLITVLVIIAIGAGVYGVTMYLSQETGEPIIIGSDRDEYGCLGSAGYGWNEEVSACIRDGELDENKRKAANIAVKHIGYLPGTTIVEVATARCQGCFSVMLEQGVEHSMNTHEVRIADWKVVEGDFNVSVDDWATYTNDDYGFSLKYPEAWLLDDAPSDTVTVSLRDASDSIQIDFLGVDVVSPDTNAREELAILGIQYGEQVQATTLNGYDAIIRNDDSGSRIYYIPDDDSYVKITLSSLVADNDQTVKAILSTITFSQ